MTGVDRLHSSGIKGKGVKIGILDTGVDYYHPALGGCFGPGCKISFGYDLVGDDYNGYNTPVPDDDPLATCSTGGHGTHVTGIIGMEVPDDYPLFNGLVGVAPEASIGMYRVLGCSGGVGTDVLVAGMVRAADDGVDVISISIGGAIDFDAIQGNVTGSKEDYVVIVKRGLCGLALIQSNAAAAGFRNVLTYPDKDVLGNPFLQGYAAAIPVTDDNGVPLNFGTTTNNKIYVGAKKSTDYSVRFTDATPELVRQSWGGQMNNFSSAAKM
ncbi:putative thermostable alkaline protease protein [Phaeoacremonium minimum UCRPA7]|uniref:Putative thermostable alkaline protease protein n=1 Tax=Phaeoacremonium minimum (strain UCR-PA7) TaxID=1286976 RepID=R8BSV3_PHAM7|nr:putative thermostable alkaline protease protein [Phaeoacremonium minimum UCRPA7]EOO02483.1 putative thermostable alkaline protease protein [Phaeoacremonium minimum UCRPA7]